MHECFFGTKSTHWPSFLSRGGRRGSVERLVVVGKNSWQGGGIFSQLAGLPAPTGGRLLLQTPPWQKKPRQTFAFSNSCDRHAALESRLGGIERPIGKREKTIYFSLLTIFCRPSSSSQPQLHQLLCCRRVAADMVECCFPRLSQS